MTLQIKLLTGTAALATTVAGGWGIHKLTESKNVREALIEKGKTILNTESKAGTDSEDKAEWEKITSKSDLISELKKFLEIKEEDTVSNWNDKIPELKKKCSETLEIRKDHKDFLSALQNAEKYCVQVQQ